MTRRKTKSEQKCTTDKEYARLRESLHEIALEVERLNDQAKNGGARIEDIYPLADRLGVDRADLLYFFV